MVTRCVGVIQSQNLIVFTASQKIAERCLETEGVSILMTDDLDLMMEYCQNVARDEDRTQERNCEEATMTKIKTIETTRLRRQIPGPRLCAVGTDPAANEKLSP